jgi:hypothetical protein
MYLSLISNTTQIQTQRAVLLKQDTTRKTQVGMTMSVIL